MAQRPYAAARAACCTGDEGAHARPCTRCALRRSSAQSRTWTLETLGTWTAWRAEPRWATAGGAARRPR
eukprot:423317-Pyramimonas_sp.AAC.1